MAGFISLAVKNIVQPSIVGGLVLDHSEQESVVCIPKYVLGNFKDQNVICVVVLDILQLEFWRLDVLLPRVCP